MPKLPLKASAAASESAMRKMLDQLNIALLNRLGGRISLPIEEVDATGDYDMSIEFDDDRGTVTCVLWPSTARRA